MHHLYIFFLNFNKRRFYIFLFNCGMEHTMNFQAMLAIIPQVNKVCFFPVRGGGINSFFRFLGKKNSLFCQNYWKMFTNFE